MEVSVAGVEDIPVRDRVSCGDGGNLGQRIREPGAGHGAVGHEIVGGQPGNGAERPAPSRPKQVPLCGVLRLTDLAAAVLHAQLADPFGLLLQPRCRSIHLGNQHGGCVQRITARHALLHRPHHGGIHHLQRRRNDPRRDDVGHGPGGIRHVVVNRQKRHYRLGRRKNPHDQFGYDTERPLAADQQPAKVITRRIPGRPANPHNLATGKDQGHPKHVICGHAVFQAVRAARVLPHVPAQRSDLLAGRIRCVEEPQRGERVLQFEIRHPRLNDGVSAFRPDVQNAVQTRQVDYQPALGGNASSRKVRAEPSGYVGYAGFGGGPNYGSGLVGVGGQDRRLRHPDGQ